MIRTREQFLADRRNGIGGSDIAAIVGISPWKTPRDIYIDKINREDDTGKTETDAIHFGQVLEDVVAKEFSLRTGIRVQRVNKTLHHPDNHLFLADIDRVCVTSPGKSPVCRKSGMVVSGEILECKTASAYSHSEWGPSDSDMIPEYYRAQCQWYLGVTGAAVCHLAVLIGNCDFRIYHINSDTDIIQYLFMRGGEFWNTYVLPRVLPPPCNIADVEKQYGAPKRDRVFADDNLIALIDKMRSQHESLAELKNILADEQKIICEAIGNNTELVAPGGEKLCSWSMPVEKEETDWKGLCLELGPSEEQKKKYTQSKKTARRFTLAKKKETKE